MRYVIATALAALSYVVCGYFVNDPAKGISTGFSPGELKVIPWIVFIIVFLAISKGGTRAKPTEPQSKPETTSQSSGELEERVTVKIQDAPDTHGVNLQLLSANEFLNALKNGNINTLVNDEALKSLASNTDYFNSLFSLFGQQKSKDQEIMMKTILTLPAELSLAFKNKLLSESSRVLRIWFFALLGMLPGILSIVYFLTTVTNTSKPMTGSEALAGFVIFLSLLPAISFTENLSRYLRYNHLLKKSVI